MLHDVLIAVSMVLTTPITLILLARTALNRDRADGSPELQRRLPAQRYLNLLSRSQASLGLARWVPTGKQGRHSMRLLCATDLSSRADRALRRAGTLARDMRAELVLLSVVDDDQPARLVKSQQREVGMLLSEQSTGLNELQGLAPRLRVEAGDAFDVIIQVANAERADLVVMGEHRKRLLRDVFVGTTIERVMRVGGRPVLMVNAPAERPYRRLLAAMDISEPAAHALRTAHRLGFLGGSELTVFHAFEPLPGRGYLKLADVSDEAIQDHVQGTAAEQRAKLTRFLQEMNIGADLSLSRIVMDEGLPAPALRQVVARLSPDLVVVGTRGLGALGRLLLGSVAEEALRTLNCDVLAVPLPP